MGSYYYVMSQYSSKILQRICSNKFRKSNPLNMVIFRILSALTRMTRVFRISAIKILKISKQ